MFVATIASLAIVLSASVDAVAFGNQTELLTARASKCMVPEWHFDYPGDDSHDVPAATYEQCCDFCTSDSSCGAYTWTNYQGGTCYLKNHRTGSVWKGASPDGSANTISAEMYRCNTLTKDVDYEGNDLYTIQAPRAETCCQYCSVSRVCTGFSWTNFNGGTCWLKQGGKLVSKPGVISASLR